MDLHQWTLYVGVVALVIVMPGPAALLCLNHGLRHGSSRSLATVFGGTLSALVLMSVSALGLWRVLAASPLLFELARAAGVGYLMLLGVNTWREGRHATALAVAVGAPRQRSLASLCRDGFLIGISNPKDLLFFGALLPQFVDPAAPRLPQFAALFLTWALVDGVVMSGYAALGTRLLAWLVQPSRLQTFQRASGALLVAAGAGLAAARVVGPV